MIATERPWRRSESCTAFPFLARGARARAARTLGRIRDSVISRSDNARPIDRSCRGRASISPVAPWHGPLRVYAAACQPPRLARDERRGDGFSPPAQQRVAREPALSLAGGAGP